MASQALDGPPPLPLRVPTPPLPDSTTATAALPAAPPAHTTSRFFSTADAFKAEQEAAISSKLAQAALFTPLLAAIDNFVNDASNAKLSREASWAAFLIRQSAIDISASLARGTLHPPTLFNAKGPFPQPYPARSMSDSPRSRPRANDDSQGSQQSAAASASTKSGARVGANRNTEARSYAAALKSLPKGVPTGPVTSNLTAPAEDLRLFLRLPAGSQFADSHQHALATALRPSFPHGLSAPPAVSWTTSGQVAITPRSVADAELLRATAADLGRALGAPPAANRDMWTKLTIHKVPYRLRIPTGIHDVTDAQLAQEVQHAFGKVPVRMTWGHVSAHDPTTKTLLLAFSQATLPNVPSRVELFSTPLTVQASRTSQRTPQCDKCFAFHPGRCTNAARCPLCASTKHSVGEHGCQGKASAALADCRCPPRCANCLGPHKSVDPACPARPTARRPLTKSELVAMKRAGRAAWLAGNSCPAFSRPGASNPTAATAPPAAPLASSIQNTETNSASPPPSV